MNFFNKKNRRIFTIVLVAILVLSMVIPIVTSYFI
ncbi:MAG: hypothetical protein K5679_11945 [Lachnospiraceae bacterium]|nr:hypothetical protein [Lachnospiraceae bacterium]